MFDKERTDAMAATHAEMALHGLMLTWLMRAHDAGRRGLSLPYQPERTMAKEVMDTYAVQLEHRDRQRRVVLYGDWEIDPAKVTFVSAVKGP